jgi:hypothetical protein
VVVPSRGRGSAGGDRRRDAEDDPAGTASWSRGRDRGGVRSSRAGRPPSGVRWGRRREPRRFRSGSPPIGPAAQDHDGALRRAHHPGGGGLITSGVSTTSGLEPSGQEAGRGTSVYLADSTYPMLPSALVRALRSLRRRRSLTVSVVADLGPDGELKNPGPGGSSKRGDAPGTDRRTGWSGRMARS